MGIVIKQSIRSSLLAYFGVAIGAINILFLYPKFLSSDEIGLIRVIGSAAFLMATLAQFGMAPSILKFLPEYNSEQRKKSFLGFILLVALLGYLAMFGATYIFKDQILNYYADKSPLFSEYFQFSILISFFLVYIQIAESYSRSLLKSIPPILIRDVILRLLITISVLLYAMGVVNFNEFINLFMLLYGIIMLSHVGYLLSIKAFNFSLNFSTFQKADVSKVLKYGVFTLIGASGTQIVLQIDSLMVAGIEGLNATGIYTVAFYIGTMIEIPRRSIVQITAPLISQAFQKNDMREVAKYYKQTSINQLVIGGLLWLGIWANLESIYSLMPNNEIYEKGFNVVLLIGLAKLMDMLFGVNGEIIVMSKYYKMNVVTVAILAIAIIVGNRLLIPEYGIEGAALASLLAMLFFNLIKLGFVYMKFGIQPFSLNTLKFFGIILVVISVNLNLPVISNVILDILFRSAVITVILIGLTYFLNVSSEINGIINRLIKRPK